jgi:hypothetical protein
MVLAFFSLSQMSGRADQITICAALRLSQSGMKTLSRQEGKAAKQIATLIAHRQRKF